MSWQAYWPNDTTAKSLSPKDLFDCDGSKQINALVIDESATWCNPCMQEAGTFGTNMASGGKWASIGVALVTLIGSNSEGSGTNTATIMDAQSWRTMFNQTTCYDGVDGPMAPFVAKEGGFPSLFLIDPRTMKITVEMAGDDGTFEDSVTKLATMNKK